MNKIMDLVKINEIWSKDTHFSRRACELFERKWMHVRVDKDTKGKNICNIYDQREDRTKQHAWGLNQSQKWNLFGFGQVKSGVTQNGEARWITLWYLRFDTHGWQRGTALIRNVMDAHSTACHILSKSLGDLCEFLLKSARLKLQWMGIHWPLTSYKYQSLPWIIDTHYCSAFW